MSVSSHPLTLERCSVENPVARRRFLAQVLSLPFLSFATNSDEPKKNLKIMMKSAWGSDDPTKAAFPFLHALALSEAGHEVQIFLLGEATDLMRKVTANAVVPVGWPPLSETLEKITAKHIPVFAGLRLRSLQPGPWGHGSRLGAVGSKIRQSHNLRELG
jgi:hypothetical protein